MAAGSALEVCQHSLARSAEQEEALHCRLYEEAAAASQLRRALAAEEAALAEALEAGRSAWTRIGELSERGEATSAECATLQSELSRSRAETSRFRGLAASWEVQAAQEHSWWTEAEASSSRLREDLAAAESRLANRGTHVELLLREKERLWSQLSTARRQPASGGEGGRARPCSPQVAQGSSDQAARASRPASAGAGAGTASGSAATRPAELRRDRFAVEDLERQLWHTRRALERERQSHEETREVLLRARAV